MRILVSCILIVLLLCGCSDQQQMDRAMVLRQKLLDTDGCSFQCDITADYLEKVYVFSVECSFNAAGDMTFCVREPSSIAGITGNVDSQGGKLTFDEQALAFEVLADGYISPISAPWFFIKSLRSGYIASCGSDEEYFRVALNDSYAENALQVDVWFDVNNTPIKSEIVWMGRRILSLDVSNFSYL